MRTYQEKRSHPLKWVFGMMVLVLLLTVTFDDAYGIWLPKSDGSSSDSPQPQQNREIVSMDTKCPPPPEVPEPGTLLLLGSGMAALHFLRKKKRVN